MSDHLELLLLVGKALGLFALLGAMLGLIVGCVVVAVVLAVGAFR